MKTSDCAMLAAVFAAAFLVGCGERSSPAADAADAPATEPAATDSGGAGGPGGVRLYALDCGRIDVADFAPFADDGAYDGEPGVAPVSCFLVQNGDRELLWDAGLPAALIGNGPMTDDVFTLTLARTIADQMTEIGLAPGDVDFLALSHSHFDHTGQASEFAGAEWLVDPLERQWMFDPETAASGLVQPDAVEGLKAATQTEIADGHDVFGDGSAIIVSTPGHTPGHKSLLVRTANSGSVLISGDLYHRNRSRVERKVPVFNVDRDMTLLSMDKFEALARQEGARVVIQHSEDDLAALPKFPAYLD